MKWFGRKRKPPLLPARIGSVVRTDYERCVPGEWVLVGIAWEQDPWASGMTMRAEFVEREAYERAHRTDWAD